MAEYELKEFLKEFLTEGIGFQICRFDNGSFKVIADETSDIIKFINEYIYTTYSSVDLYFQRGCRAGSKTKAKTADVIATNSFFIDIDLRKDRKKVDGYIMTDEEIAFKAEYIKSKIDTHEDLKQYYSIDFSGNGLHIWYIGNQRLKLGVDITAQDYSNVINSLYDEFDNLFEEGEYIRADRSCRSIEKLCRLPLTFNVKSRIELGLQPKVSEILWFPQTHTNLFDD